MSDSTRMQSVSDLLPDGCLRLFSAHPGPYEVVRRQVQEALGTLGFQGEKVQMVVDRHHDLTKITFWRHPDKGLFLTMSMPAFIDLRQSADQWHWTDSF